MPISQNGIWAPRRIQCCTRSHLNLEYLPRLRPELLYSKNLGERVQRRVFHNQARCQNIPKREVLGEHWLAKKKKKKKKSTGACTGIPSALVPEFNFCQKLVCL